MSQRPQPLYNEAISKLFTALFYVVIATFSLSILTYGESFHFWSDALSDLGTTVTKNGFSNQISFIVIAIGMILSGYLTLKISAYFARHSELQHYRSKRLITLLAAIGFLLFSAPHNIWYILHSVGAGLMVGDLWALGSLILLEQKVQLSVREFILYQLILQITVLAYAFTFFINVPIRQAFQKFAVLGLLFVLKKITAIPQKLAIKEVLAAIIGR